MTDEEMREKALKLITPFIDDEWHGKGYPVKAELIADGLIPLIREETLKQVTCTQCGVRVAGSFGDKVIIRAFIQCPECVEIVRMKREG
uniref:Uncharacterized protein n=1 Tax=viral metagenome TaxID=1070528 RepID=A0A6M3XYM2_9ZZZZ